MKYQKKQDKCKAIAKCTRKIVKDELKKVFELKFHNFSSASSLLGSDALGTIFQLNQVAVGTSDSQRIGDKIVPKSLDVSLTLRVSSSTAPSTVRIVIFGYKDSYDATSGAPLQADIINSIYGSSVNAVNAPRNMDKLRNFNIVYDAKHHINIDMQIKQINIHRKRFAPCQYQAGNTNYGTNSIWMACWSDDVSGTTGRPSINFVSQLHYTDA